MNKIQLQKLKIRAYNIVVKIDKKNNILDIYKRYYKNNKGNNSKIDMLNNADDVIVLWPTTTKKPLVGLVRESEEANAYWPKYEKFLIRNEIPYKFYDPHKSDFLIKAQEFDIIVWRTNSCPFELWEAKTKIELLNRFLNLTVIPKEDELWFYEEKHKQQWLFEINNIPCIKTFITYSYAEAKEFINNVQYPIISKETTSAGSQGVFMIKRKSQAWRFVKSVFSSGSKTTNSYLRQKNYVIFQEFTPNYGFDLRVIVIGDQFLGYYRHVPENDFRASGAGIYSKKTIPKEALLLAKRVKDSFPKTNMLAIDMLQDKRDDLFKVIETSIFIGVDTCEQLKVDGVPGLYRYKDGEFYFEPGRYWIQELALKEAMEEWINNQSKLLNEDSCNKQ